MNVYVTDYILDFPASEYGGQMVWVANDESHLGQLIYDYIDRHQRDNSYAEEDYVTVDSLVESSTEVDPTHPGIVSVFPT